ncbi:MAG: hypothetical protein ABF297_00495, partial [Thiogranum sp.]
YWTRLLLDPAGENSLNFARSADLKSDCGRYKNTAKARRANNISETRLSFRQAGFFFYRA